MKTFLRLGLGLLLGLVLFLALLELRLRTVASPSVAVESEASGDSIRILALGDSITHGGFKEASYPFALKSLLEKELGRGSAPRKVQIWNLGITGAETRDLYQKIETWIAQYRPHVVITMVGAGDRNTAPGISAAFRELRVLRLADVAWKSWRTELGRWWAGLGKGGQGAAKDQDPLAGVANDFYATGRDDVDYIRTLHDPLLATDRIKSAERIHRRMLLRWPKHEHARLALGLCRQKMGAPEEAEELFRSVIADFEKKPEARKIIHWAYFSLASLLAELEREKELEALLHRLIETYPWNEHAYEHLAVLYRKQNKGMELQKLLEKGIATANNADRLRMMLARYFRETGHEAEALEQEKTVRGILEKNLQGERTAPAYRALSARITASGALHLAMQYPMLDVGLLPAVLGPEGRDLRFVSNESFREALAKKQYAFYFLDDFGGLYGHLTQPGAELMAKNVAAVLLPALKERGL